MSVFFLFLGGGEGERGPASVAYGSSQARGQIRVAAATLRHSHSNARSELHLQPASQLKATSDPYSLSEEGDQTQLLMDTRSGS